MRSPTQLSAIGLEVESVDDPADKLGAFTRRAHPRGQAASQRRQAAGRAGRGREGRAAARGRVRRAQRARRPDRRVRAARHLHSRHRRSRSRRSPCAASCRTACCARSASWSSPTSHQGIIELPAEHGEQRRRALRRRDGPRRSRVRGEADAQPARLHGRARHRARSRRRRPRHAEAGEDDHRASRATYDCPVDIKLEFSKEASDACPCFAGALHQGRQERPVAGLAAAAPQGGRPAAHQRAGRRDQLHQPRSRPAAARLRRRQAQGRHPRAARQDGREVPRPRRQGARGRRDHVRDRRRQRPRSGFGGIMGGEASGCTDATDERADRVRLLRSAAHGRDGPQDRPRDATRAIASSAASIRPSSCRASISPRR